MNTSGRITDIEQPKVDIVDNYRTAEMRKAEIVDVSRAVESQHGFEARHRELETQIFESSLRAEASNNRILEMQKQFLEIANRLDATLQREQLAMEQEASAARVRDTSICGDVAFTPAARDKFWGESRVLEFGIQDELQDIHLQGIRDELDVKASAEASKNKVLEIEEEFLEIANRLDAQVVSAARVRELTIRVSQLNAIVAGTSCRDIDGPYASEWLELFRAQNELHEIRVQGIRDELDAEASAATLKQLAKVATRKARQEKKSLAVANRLAEEKQQMELEANAAREKSLRDGIQGLVLGCPHWSVEAMDAMEILLSFTSQEDIDAVHDERPKFILALKNLVDTGETIAFDHHKITECEKIFANTFFPHLATTFDVTIDSVKERLQKLYWENYTNGRLDFDLENYRRCSMYWYLCLKTLDAYRLSRVIIGKSPPVLQPSLKFRPKYTVENNWTLEESTYVQFKQRAIEVQIGNQAYSLVSDWLKTVTVRSYDLLVGYSFAPKSKYVIKTSAVVDERSLALWKLQERVFVGLSSDVEVGSQLEPTSDFRKETNFDEASKVQQKTSQISSGGRMSIAVSASSKPDNTSPGNGCETQGEFSKQTLVLIGLDDDTAYKDSDTLPALQQSDRIEIRTVHADPPDKKPPEYGESCIGWTAEVRPQPPDAEIEKFADVASERYDKSFEYDGDRNRFFEWTFDIFTGQSHVQSWRERVIGWFAEVLPQPPDTFSYRRRSSVLFWIVEICLRPPDPCSSELRFCDFFDTATRMISFL